MIFLTAFTNNIIIKDYKRKRKFGQFFNEYIYLLRSIRIFYPDAIPVLYLFQGSINEDGLKHQNPNLIIHNWNKRFRPELGIDLNIILALKEAMTLYDDDIILLDTDCLVVKKFDELLIDPVDITSVTRGKISWNDRRHYIIFGPSIYHKSRKSAVYNYLNELFRRGYEVGSQTGDWWANVQPCITDIYMEAGIATDIKEPHYGAKIINGCIVKLKVISQYIFSYPIQDEKFYDETCIIHYKNHRLRYFPNKLFNKWCLRVT